MPGTSFISKIKTASRPKPAERSRRGLKLARAFLTVIMILPAISVASLVAPIPPSVRRLTVALPRASSALAKKLVTLKSEATTLAVDPGTLPRPPGAPSETLIIGNSADAVNVLSFREWKAAKAQEWVITFQRLRNHLDSLKDAQKSSELKASNTKDIAETAQVHLLEQQLRSQRQRWDYVRELSISDYVATYLSKFKNRKLLSQKVSQELTKEEVSHLLLTLIEMMRVPTELENPADLPTAQ